MIKPQNIPGAGVVTDTLDFVKNLWGAMNVPGVTTLPGMAAPTLSIEELDKKINDLKAVEAWLNLNMGMLRGSIQALEVQRGTIATLKSMGATLSNAVKQPLSGDKSSEKSLLESIPYASAFLFPNANPVPTTPDEMAANIAAEAGGQEVEPAAESADAPEEQGNTLKTPDFGAQLAQAGAWWGMLQEQFKQAVSSALAAENPLTKGVAGSAAKEKSATPDSSRPRTRTKAAAKPEAAPKTRRSSPAKAKTTKTGGKKTTSTR